MCEPDGLAARLQRSTLLDPCENLVTDASSVTMMYSSVTADSDNDDDSNEVRQDDSDDDARQGSRKARMRKHRPSNSLSLHGIAKKPQREKQTRRTHRRWRSEAAEASYGVKTWSDILRYLAIKARENEVTLESFLVSGLECVTVTSCPSRQDTASRTTGDVEVLAPTTQLLMSCSL